LEDVEPEIFSIYVNWTYGQQIRNGDSGELEGDKLLKLWLLADRLPVPKLQNQAMNALMTYEYTGGFSKFAVAKVYEYAIDGCPLRHLLVDND